MQAAAQCRTRGGARAAPAPIPPAHSPRIYELLRTDSGRAPEPAGQAPERTPDSLPDGPSLPRAQPRAPRAVQARVPPPRVAHAVARAAESTEIILV
ncbi:hypothetical protein GCM10022420_022690 [Streptomyces iranensis]